MNTDYINTLAPDWQAAIRSQFPNVDLSRDEIGVWHRGPCPCKPEGYDFTYKRFSEDVCIFQDFHFETKYIWHLPSANKVDIQEAKAKAAALGAAQALWDAAKECTSHPYLTDKGLEPVGLRVAENGDLLVPGVDGRGGLISLQRVSLEYKKFGVGLNSKGASYRANHPGFTWIAVTESLGNALAIYHSFPNVLAVGTFGKDNLNAVTRGLKRQYPNLKIVVVADADRNREGQKKAKEAAIASECHLCIPVFLPFQTLEGGKTPTDIADTWKLSQAEGVRNTLERARLPKEVRVNQLAELSLLEYDEVREEESHELGISLGVLDKAVAAARTQSSGGEDPGMRAADVLRERALKSGATFWHDNLEVAWITFELEGHQETIRLRSTAGRRFLQNISRKETGRTVGHQTLQDTVDILEHDCIEGPVDKAYCRVCYLADEHVVYLDLADKSRQVVRITARGWDVVKQPAVRFYRTNGMLALPVPVSGGSLSDLYPFLTCEPGDRPLILAWLLGCLGPGPYPILALSGEHGSGKSTAASLILSLIDPHESPTKQPPKETRDLFIAASRRWVYALDNLDDHLSPWLSNTMCVVSTGGGFSCRLLYSDQEEQIFQVCRPQLVTGISRVGSRADFRDRCIHVTLPVLEDEDRLAVLDLEAELQKVKPQLLGALLSAAVSALANGATSKKTCAKDLRMLDFVSWVVGAEIGGRVPWRRGEFESAYRGTRNQHAQEAVEGDCVAVALVKYMEGRESQAHSTKDWLEALTGVTEAAVTKKREWPQSSDAIGRRFRRLAPDLRKGAGLDVRRVMCRNEQKVLRLWEVTRISGNTPPTDDRVKDDETSAGAAKEGQESKKGDTKESVAFLDEVASSDVAPFVAPFENVAPFVAPSVEKGATRKAASDKAFSQIYPPVTLVAPFSRHFSYTAEKNTLLVPGGTLTDTLAKEATITTSPEVATITRNGGNEAKNGQEAVPSLLSESQAGYLQGPQYHENQKSKSYVVNPITSAGGDMPETVQEFVTGGTLTDTSMSGQDLTKEPSRVPPSTLMTSDTTGHFLTSEEAKNGQDLTKEPSRVPPGATEVSFSGTREKGRGKGATVATVATVASGVASTVAPFESEVATFSEGATKVIHRFPDWLSQASLIAMDIETTPLTQWKEDPKAGLDPYHSQIRLISVSDGVQCLVFDMRVDPIKMIEPLLEKTLVFHNATFDLGHLMKAGLIPKQVRCTELLARVWNQEKGNVLKTLYPSLAAVARECLDITLDKRLQTSDWGKEYLSIEQLEYAAQDAKVTYQLYQWFCKHWAHPGLEIFHDALLPTAMMALWGIGFDRELHTQLMHPLEGEVIKRHTDFLRQFNGLNPYSNHDISAWVSANVSAEDRILAPKTAKGLVSVAKKVLKANPHWPVSQPLLKLRKAAKLLSSYGPNFLPRIHPTTGRVHANFRVHGAITGRTLSSRPNTQQFPRDSGIRSLFISEDCFIAGDYIQLEIRISALLSQDSRMLSVLRAGGDIYKDFASSAFKTEVAAVTKEQRTQAKVCILGMSYGMQAQELRAQLNCTRLEAENLLRAFHSTYSGLSRFMSRAAEQTEVILIGGRYRCLADRRPTERINAAIQGAAATVLRQAEVNLWRILPIVNSVHDELVVEVPLSGHKPMAWRASLRHYKQLVMHAMASAFEAYFPNHGFAKLVEMKPASRRLGRLPRAQALTADLKTLRIERLTARLQSGHSSGRVTDLAKELQCSAKELVELVKAAPNIEILGQKGNTYGSIRLIDQGQEGGIPGTE